MTKDFCMLCSGTLLFNPNIEDRVWLIKQDEELYNTESTNWMLDYFKGI